MAYISFQPSDFFNTVLYTGNGSNPRTLTGVGFDPDFVWIKNRSVAYGHGLSDSSRGTSKTLISNSDVAEQTNYSYGFVSAFSTDGFGVNAGASGDNFVNETGNNYVAWNWRANGGTTSSNTDGSITSTVQANTTSGFSIVTYTGTGANATVGHGLGKAPSFLVTKSRSTTGYAWVIWHSALAGNESLEFITDAKATTPTSWNSTVPTSSVFSLGTRLGTNASGNDFVAYCFAEIKGYSKFGSYTGNGSTNGTFVYTGFRPAFVMTKRTNAVGPWNMKDTKRPGYNDTDDSLFANSNAAEDTRGFDILSNGFKLRNSGTEMNGGGSTYIYMAFAEFPLVGSNGLAGTAR